MVNQQQQLPSSSSGSKRQSWGPVLQAIASYPERCEVVANGRGTSCEQCADTFVSKAAGTDESGAISYETSTPRAYSKAANLPVEVR